MQQAEIERSLCININKPELLCSGKCVLNERLKADDGDSNNSTLPQQLKKAPETTFLFAPVAPKLYIETTPPTSSADQICFSYQSPVSRKATNGIFRPPQLG